MSRSLQVIKEQQKGDRPCRTLKAKASSPKQSDVRLTLKFFNAFPMCPEARGGLNASVIDVPAGVSKANAK